VLTDARVRECLESGRGEDRDRPCGSHEVMPPERLAGV
jgi:hypothetical protein